MDPSFLNKWVAPFYLDILHGNYANLNGSELVAQFVANVKAVLPDLDSTVLVQLIDYDGWREAMVGSWFAGVTGAVELQDRIGERLNDPGGGYSDQAHAFALARFGTANAREYLVTYLNTILENPDHRIQLFWALPAMMWLDVRLGVTHSEQFVGPGSVWERMYGDDHEEKLRQVIEHFKMCMAFVDYHFKSKAC